MNRKQAVAIVLFIFTAMACSPSAIPETTVTRTHLMKDIQQSTATIGVGVEFFEEDPESLYTSDALFAYIGFAPLDWLEFGIALHTARIAFFPMAEATIDVIDLFTDSSRLSFLLMGGIGGITDDDVFYLIYHGGAALNLRLKESFQLYLGAGSDSLSTAVSLQAGVYVPLFEWLGLSMNIKLVTGPEGTERMFSAAPLATIRA